MQTNFRLANAPIRPCEVLAGILMKSSQPKGFRFELPPYGPMQSDATEYVRASLDPHVSRLL
jgi:hypothetical protein